MPPVPTPVNLQDSILSWLRRDFIALQQDHSVQEALVVIRQQEIGDKIVYFYVVDDNDSLVGVLPTRKLLTAMPEQRLRDIMISRVVAIPQSASVLEACEFFVLHRFLAFPVTDDQHRLLGVVDIGIFTNKVFDLAEREQVDDLFETIGFHAAQLRGLSLWQTYRLRFPWLLATVFAGLLCAGLAGIFQVTLETHLILSFFLALVLGLGESVSMQAMAVAIQSLRATPPTFRWYIQALGREMGQAFLLGGSCGLLVSLLICVWQGLAMEVLVIGLGTWLAVQCAAFYGLSMPTLLHGLKLDPKIAAGPIALACADLTTLLGYFTVASILL